METLLPIGNFFQKQTFAIELFKKCVTVVVKLCLKILGNLGTSKTFVKGVLL
jgi:hypothetical protein